MLLKWIRSDRFKSRLGWLLLEVVLIVMGVLLGLWANQWRAEQANEHDAQQALQLIREELRFNHSQLESVLPYHRQMDQAFDTLAARIVDQEGTTVTHAELWQAMPQGFKTPLIQSSAWELTKQTGTVRHIDLELARRLSMLYEGQAFYKQKLDVISENLYVAANVNVENFASTALAYNLLVGDIVIQEERFAQHYPQMIQRLEEIERRD